MVGLSKQTILSGEWGLGRHQCRCLASVLSTCSGIRFHLPAMVPCAGSWCRATDGNGEEAGEGDNLMHLQPFTHPVCPAELLNTAQVVKIGRCDTATHMACYPEIPKYVWCGCPVCPFREDAISAVPSARWLSRLPVPSSCFLRRPMVRVIMKDIVYYPVGRVPSWSDAHQCNLAIPRRWWVKCITENA